MYVSVPRPTSIERTAEARPFREWLALGNVTVDPTDPTVWRGTEPVVLSPTGHGLLLCFAMRPDTVLPYDELLEALMAAPATGLVLVRRAAIELRRKLAWTGVAGAPDIQWVRDRGYRLALAH